jgi:LCP family protein required for cell wall assembly
MKKREKVIIALLILLIIGGAVGFLICDYQRQGGHSVSSYGSGEDPTPYKHISVDGTNYTFNPRINTILYMGVDSTEGTLEENVGQADTIILFVMNKKTGKLTAINFSRDTMTELQSYDVQGQLAGTLTNHLGYAYTFGGGGEKSCENVIWSISNLLHGIPIEEYCATDVQSIVKLNDLIGGVTVTVPNDDLVDEYPEMTAGSLVELTSDNVERFVRYRDIEIDFSNTGRQERQKAYLDAYLPKLEEQLKTDMDGLWNSFTELENNTITSITRNKYIDIVNTFGEMDLSDIEFYTPEGLNQKGERHDEFYIDEEKLMQKILEIFYITD